MAVDCRSLIEFCRAFEHHRNISDQHRRSRSPGGSPRGKRSKSPIPFSNPFCEHSTSAAVDVVLLLLVLGALAVLTVPYLKLILREASDLLPTALFLLLGDVISGAPAAYAAGFVLMFAVAVALWEIVCHHSRKCGSPYCKGLRKAVEFDIQLESEECVRYLPPVPKDPFGALELELGQDHKELEAELKKMAPPNGRAVLIFRSPCGCPAGRMEVWGPKKVRRIKK